MNASWPGAVVAVLLLLAVFLPWVAVFGLRRLFWRMQERRVLRRKYGDLSMFRDLFRKGP